MIDELVELVRGGASPHVVIGPVVWEAASGKRRWYFTIASANGDGAHFDQVASDNRELTEAARASLFLRVVKTGPIVIHECDDELEMARLCEMLWPSPKTRKLRLALEAERGTENR